ncbi:hypothetical protein BDZ91DRAFT_729506 [Kalaharituber pfeilii]|nr:hypothetical protein BDZ91DRAFT_729506 [Kalaharituber pfeilii]
MKTRTVALSIYGLNLISGPAETKMLFGGRRIPRSCMFEKRFLRYFCLAIAANSALLIYPLGSASQTRCRSVHILELSRFSDKKLLHSTHLEPGLGSQEQT